MPRLVEIRHRIGVVRNIETVARTMATVASAKLSKTHERAIGMRAYMERVRRMVAHQALAAGEDLASLTPYYRAEESGGPVLALVLSGDRGMCGGHNLAVSRLAADLADTCATAGREVAFIAKGLKGARYLERRENTNVLRSEGWPKAGVTPAEVERLAAELSAAFLDGGYSRIVCVYTRFISTVRGEPTVETLLPLPLEVGAADGPGSYVRWCYEPERREAIEALLDAYLTLQVEDVMLESFASEQAARMITMEEASERARTALRELTVCANRVRREAITTDLIGVLYAARMRHGAHA